MRRRGFTTVELVVAMTVLAMVVMGTSAMMITGLRSFDRTTNSVTITQQNAQNIRRISESLRGATNVRISSDGTTIRYNYPLLTPVTDPITGEREMVDPLTSDGIERGFQVDFSQGVLRELETGRILVRNLISRDPEERSSQFNQVYQPFQPTTVGSLRGITINLITQLGADEHRRTARMKTTVLVRNSQ
jgi:prepilin-type N-terminal cleavage/methylation domain-containing protein